MGHKPGFMTIFLMVIICFKIFVVAEFGLVNSCYNVHSYEVYSSWNGLRSWNNLALRKAVKWGEIFKIFLPKGSDNLILWELRSISLCIYSYILHKIYFKVSFPHEKFPYQ